MSVTITKNRFAAVAVAAQIAADEELAASGERIAEAARAACPVDTGALQGSIASGSAGPGSWEVSAGRGLPDGRAVYAEYGTGARGDASQFPGKPADIPYRGDWPGQRAQPYMTPA